jgi:hypothetical protein
MAIDLRQAEKDSDEIFLCLIVERTKQIAAREENALSVTRHNQTILKTISSWIEPILPKIRRSVSITLSNDGLSIKIPFKVSAKRINLFFMVVDLPNPMHCKSSKDLVEWRRKAETSLRVLSRRLGRSWTSPNPRISRFEIDTTNRFFL